MSKLAIVAWNRKALCSVQHLATCCKVLLIEVFLNIHGATLLRATMLHKCMLGLKMLKMTAVCKCTSIGCHKYCIYIYIYIYNII